MRRLLSGVLTAFLAAGTLTLLVGPAEAAPAKKTRVEMSSGTIAIGAGRKEVTFTVTNISDKPLRKPRLDINQESYNSDQVSFPFNDKVCGPGPVLTMECPLSPDPLPPGRSAKVTLDLEVEPGASPGPAGTLIVYTNYEGGGDSFDFPLTVSPAQGPDLFLRASDVPAGGGTLEPGKSARAEYVFGNNGELPAKNIFVRITLPRGATIGRLLPDLPQCTAGDRTATCAFTDDVLAPHTAVRTFFPIVLDADAKRGVNLTGRIEIIHSEVATAADLAKAKRAKSASAAAVVTDIDNADNRDKFQILVAPRKPAENGGSGGSDGDDGDDDGPVLPITGPVAASIGGVGAALLGIGVLLLMATRRRRSSTSER